MKTHLWKIKFKNGETIANWCISEQDAIIRALHERYMKGLNYEIVSIQCDDENETLFFESKYTISLR